MQESAARRQLTQKARTVQAEAFNGSRTSVTPNTRIAIVICSMSFVIRDINDDVPMRFSDCTSSFSAARKQS